MTFHHTKIVQGKRPKPHLRLHVDKPTAEMGEHLTVTRWKVERIAERVRNDGTRQPVIVDRTSYWPTSALALDAAFYQFSCEWPAPRPGR
jgi:hypothetical protein